MSSPMDDGELRGGMILMFSRTASPLFRRSPFVQLFSLATTVPEAVANFFRGTKPTILRMISQFSRRTFFEAAGTIRTLSHCFCHFIHGVVLRSGRRLSE